MGLREIVLPLRKWWWLIIIATLLGGVSGYMATRQQPPIYRTRATIMVGNTIDNPNPSGNEFYLTQQLANTYADIAKRDNLREAVQQALGLSWLPDYTARVVPETQLVEITVIDNDPLRAQIVANELATQLVNASPTSPDRENQARQEFIAEQLSELETKIKETQDQTTERQDELAGMFSARQIADVQAQIAALQTKLTTLQANYAALLSNTPKGAVNAVNVIESARLPTSPVGPNRMATILLALAIGFVLSTGAAYFLEYLDDTLKNPDEIQKAVGLNTLGAVPELRHRKGRSELVMLDSSQSAGAESFRVLRTNLQFAAVDRPLCSILVTSPEPNDGKSLTAVNLAISLAQSGRRVVLVDADLHRPRLHRLLGLSNGAGLTSALLESEPVLDGLLQETAVPGLRVLTSGMLPPNPSELLGSSRMRALLNDLLMDADNLVLDSPPVVALSDAVILSAQADGVLLVLEAGKSRREWARRAIEALRHVNAHVLGAVLNRMPKRGGGSYYYYPYHSGRYCVSGNGMSAKGAATCRRAMAGRKSGKDQRILESAVGREARGR
jgi:succinoglycan biosynthesis transport protein ExoP